MTHEIQQPWRDGIAEALGVVQELMNSQARAKAQMFDLQESMKLAAERERQTRSHISAVIAMIAKEANLPEPIQQYSLSPDGTAIVGPDPHPRSKT